MGTVTGHGQPGSLGDGRRQNVFILLAGSPPSNISLALPPSPLFQSTIWNDPPQGVINHAAERLQNTPSMFLLFPMDCALPFSFLAFAIAWIFLFTSSLLEHQTGDRMLQFPGTRFAILRSLISRKPGYCPFWSPGCPGRLSLTRVRLEERPPNIGGYLI